MEQSFFLTRVLAALTGGGDKVLFHRDGTDTTYRAALEILRRLHAALAITPDDVVAIVGGNRPETILAQLAAQLRGATVLLVATSSSLPDRQAALKAAGVTTLVLDPARESAGLVADRVLSLSDLLVCQRDQPISWASSVKLIFPTGGTTGSPKLIQHSGIYDGMAHIFAPDPAGPNRTLLVAPMSHMTGNATVLGALLRGDTLVLHDGFDAEAVLRTIEKHRITTLSLTPARLAAVLDHPALAATDLSSVRSLSLGASPLSAHRLQQALGAFGPVVGQGYGLTEAPMIASISAAELIGHPERLESVGRIVPGMEARIEDGEVLVRGLSMMDGYHGQPPMGDGWLRTGDIGRFDDEGYLYLLDRANDVIITGEHGTKVYSNVIENALATHPFVRAAAVIAIPAAGTEGELMHAFVVPSTDALTADDVKAHALATFGRPHFVPFSVDFVDALPLTAIGKIDKVALRAPFWSGRPRHIA